jgi:hypothetical protein
VLGAPLAVRSSLQERRVAQEDRCHRRARPALGLHRRLSHLDIAADVAQQQAAHIGPVADHLERLQHAGSEARFGIAVRHLRHRGDNRRQQVLVRPRDHLGV